MTDLKLPKLPDRTPVKLSITVNAELAHALREYRDVYQATYGAAEDVVELIPYMLAAFIESDAGFKRTKRQCHPGTQEPFPRSSDRRHSPTEFGNAGKAPTS